MEQLELDLGTDHEMPRCDECGVVLTQENVGSQKPNFCWVCEGLPCNA